MDTIDPKVKALVSAIGQTETGPSSPEAYSAKGKSGEFGRYQFMPDTYKTYAKKYLGDENAQPSMENQNKIAYSFVKEKKDSGYNPAQIASMWNAGEGKPDAYKENYKGTNPQGISYDTPAYVQKVSQYYEQLKNTTQSEPAQPSVPQQKDSLQSQGQPISTRDDQAQPTWAGSAIRGILKMPARATTNLYQAGEIALGKPQTEPLSGGYLGRIQPLGADPNATPEQGVSTATTSQLVKAGIGAGLETGSYLIGGGEAKAGLEAAQAGKLFTKGVLKTAGKGAIEGAGIGALGGAGSALQENKGLAGTAISTGTGALGGALTGGIFGAVGGIISKAKGITPETINAVKNQVGKDYIESLSSTVSGRKVLAENADGMQSSLESGILPNVKNGRYDTTEATNKLQDMMDKLGLARGSDIIAQNRPVETSKLKDSIIGNVNRYVSDPLEKEKVTETVNKWFNALGDKPIDLKKLNTLQISAGKLAKFENQSDATIRNAYRNIYHGIGEFINNTVGGSGGVNKEVNDTLSKYHGIMNFLDSIHEKSVKDNGLVSVLASHAAKTAGTAIGGVLGGGTGAVVASEAVPLVERVVRKVLGNNNSSYLKVMEAIRGGEEKKINDVLAQVEKNKGSKAMRDIQSALQEMKQLPAPKPGAPKSQGFIPINLPARSQSSIEKQEILRNSKKGLLR